MIQVPLERLYKGELSFEAFALQTQPYWFKAAYSLLYKWSVPPAITADDLVQEMLFKVWDLLKTYDPDRSDLNSYIIFNSIEHTKRWIHKQRGAKHFDSKAPSRFPLSYEDISIDEPRTPAYQESVIKRLEKINIASNLRERLILNRLSRIPSIDLVVQDLYNDPKIKLHLQFNSLSDAKRSVWRSILKMSSKVKTTS
jgi:DNA-directed RNA polymerase specialized sigma24 family protein